MAAEIDVYLIRHGASVMNDMPDLVCGRSVAVELSATGREQAQELGRQLHDAELRPDAAYVSPTMRTWQTARLALWAMGCKLPLLFDERLHEVSQGAYEGQRRTLYTEERIAEIKRDPWGFRAPDGESMREALRRMQDFMAELAGQPAPEPRTVVAFTHGFATRILVGDLLRWTPEEMKQAHKTPNTSLTKLFMRQGEWQVAFVGQPATALLQEMQ